LRGALIFLSKQAPQQSATAPAAGLRKRKDEIFEVVILTISK
jgi:hypothetical protein